MQQEDVVDRNLTRLLRRSYRPARPREAYRKELRWMLLERFEMKGERRRQKTPSPSVPIRMALAAALVLAPLLFWFGREPTRLAMPTTLASVDQLLARGEVALRSSAGAAWSATGEDHAILPAEALLEVRTPPGRAFRVDLMPFGALRIDTDSHVELASRGADSSDSKDGVSLKAWLRSGALTARHEEGGGLWVIATLDIPIWLRRGRLRADSNDPRGTLVRVESGTAWVQTGGERCTLTAGEEWLFAAGREPRAIAPEPTPDLSLPRVELVEATTAASVGNPPEESAPAVIVRGTVLALRGGKPVPEFRLALLQLEIGYRGEPAYGAEPRVRSVSHNLGAFELRDIAAGRYRLFIQTDGADRFSSWQSEPFLAGPDRDPIELIARLVAGAHVSGRVLDGRTGAPLAGAFVFSERDAPHLLMPLHEEWRDEMTRGAPVRGATTDALGRFELRALSPGTHSLRASLEGYAPVWIDLEELSEGGRRQDLDFLLTPGGGVRGTVTGEDHEPITGAIVSAMPYDGQIGPHARPVGLAITNEHGGYRISDLPEGICVVVLLGAEPDLTPGAAGAESVLPTQIHSGRFSVVDFARKSDAPQFRGRLFDPEGSPASGHSLSLVPTVGGQLKHDSNWSGTNTDDQGRFLFTQLVSGEHELLLSSADGRLLNSITTVEVGEQQASPPEFRLSSASISGRVLDRNTGNLVSNVAVIFLRTDASSADPRFAARINSGPNGRYRLESARPGNYTIFVEAGSKARRGEISALLLFPGQRLENIDLLLGPGGPPK